MKLYFRKDRQNSTLIITATHMTIRSLTRRVERAGHKLYMDNFYYSPYIFDDL
jgi:hypothetical protein